MEDIFNAGTPKYSTADSIYDALCKLTQTEEAGILGEMFADVSYDGQEYYYTDKGYRLKEKFEELSDYGNKMWLMDLAVWQIDQTDIHDLVFEALINPDLAKRLGFKKLFIDKMLGGDKSGYDEIVEEYLDELRELDRFCNIDMMGAFNKVMQARGKDTSISSSPYPNFAYTVAEKAKGLQLYTETRLIAECRALLTSYDDFMLGLRMNQALYAGLENQYQAKAAALQARYEEMVSRIMLAAKDQGIEFTPIDAVKMLSD